MNPDHVRKLKNVLARLEIAAEPADLDIPGFRLHRLKGDRSGTWAVTVHANWRVTFRFEDGDIVSINLEDYH